MSTAHTDGACHCGSVHTFIEREDTNVIPRPYDEGHRVWGDGVYVNPRPHTIMDINLSDLPYWLSCQCGWETDALTAGMLEIAWDAHRNVAGSGDRAVARKWRYDRADDGEVHDFLAALEDSSYIPAFIQAYGGYGDH